MGVILPDGWCGRPYGNLVVFTAANMVAGELQLVFVGLRVAGHPVVEILENSPVVTGLRVLEWAWRSHGTHEQQSRTYLSRQLTIPTTPLSSR